jgi:glycerol-3-phosphate O-acyltransferase
MNEINAVTAVTPGSLVATALLSHDRRGLPQTELIETCERLALTLHRFGARFSPSLVDTGGRGGIRGSALQEAIDMFARAQHVKAHRVADDVIYVVPPDARLSLDLAKNVIFHFFASRALIATGLLASPGPPLSMSALRERVLALSRLFKYEFTFRADASFERIFEEEVAAMEAGGELTRVVLKPSDGADGLMPKGDEGRKQIDLYARLLENFVEGYRVAARGLAALLRGPLGTKDLVNRTITSGERMFLAGDIARREAVSRPLLENAYTSFVDQGYVARKGQDLELNASYRTASAVATIESRVVAMGAPARGRQP